MYSSAKLFILVLTCILIISGYKIQASSSYDHSATTKCLVKPLKTHYGGGIIKNPEFNDGIENWSVFGQGAIKQGVSEDGNKYIVSHNRRTSFDSFSQEIQLQTGILYTLSAWVQVSEGTETLEAIAMTSGGKLIHIAEAIAKQGCWSLLKGGFVANFTGSVHLSFKSKNTRVELWSDNVSLQPFTKGQWRTHQTESIEKVRKQKVRFHITSENKKSLEGALVSIKQTKPSFPFGCGMNHYIITSTGYQNWFASRYKYTTFTNEMKWYRTEVKQGIENYTIPDAMVKFCKENGISIRGHNIFWANPKEQPDWVKTLPPEKLKVAAEKRINSVTTRYAGDLIHWDVMNENIHFRFFEDKLGENASAEYYKQAHSLDPQATVFLNEYNTLEHSSDRTVNAHNYTQKLEQIRSYPGNGEMTIGIGLQGHFGYSEPNLPYIRSSLDLLGSTGSPIWLTELDVNNGTNQSQYLEEILREAYSHPAVNGIISFSGPAVAGFKEMPLADLDFNNTPSGDVMDKLLNEWKSETFKAVTDNNGWFEVSLFHGDYDITVQHPVTKSSSSMKFQVSRESQRDSQLVNIDV